MEQDKWPISILYPTSQWGQNVCWIDLFIKYNTPLTSSAAVERLFSMGSDILRAKRSSLTADNFEKLLFIKGNLQLLDEKSISAKLDMEDEDDKDEDGEDDNDEDEDE